MTKESAMVLLVHGAWHDAWCWTRVTEILDREGIDWRAPDLALDSFAQDAAVVRGVIDNAPGDIVVVGHSRGGVVMSSATVGASNVRHLIYIASVMLGKGQTTMQNRRTTIRERAVHTDGEYSFVDPEFAREFLYADCDAEMTGQAIARLRRSAMRDRSVPIDDVVGWQTIPSTFVICTEDQCLHPDDQRDMAVWATNVIEIASSHSVMLSHPEEIASLVIDRARTA